MNIPQINNILINSKDPSIPGKRAENLKEGQDDEKLMKVCKEFEGIFLNMMLKEMKKTVEKDTLIEKSQGTEIFEEMYMEQLSDDISAGSNGVGIAEMMYRQFKRGDIQL